MRGSSMNYDDIDLNLLRVFDVMMRERSVTRAAIELGRTQSAVSHSLSKLRYLLQDELFTRDGGEMRPGEGFIRLNVGCPRSLLLQGLERMSAALTISS
ncbi:MAG: LysR family transcriptional regulator [Mesorhizobium sp.]|nr:MAG: LysR family transcriptional regulator [Mesorhizobium sp.]RWB34149.1 MAG: LysR family transcriptional regulator [Mesorhizobium sp.]RWB82041.1 MAG: LysR family transcriptional regulator [Mesorhizobium sp.]RWD22266.1 MAG: LysR family transcriptional regulator [Mesorhizobium sp.]RWD48793.1 MAG: LysR family transcriptional regulator [Mesorhizobium sp.]